MGSSKQNNSKGERNMAILTANCNRSFVVSPEKSKKFLEHKCNDDANKEILSKITTKIKEKDNNVKA